MNSLENLIIRLARKEEYKDVSLLNHIFLKEDICYGITCDDEDFYNDKDVFVAIVNDKIVGYGYGTIEEKTKDSSFYKKNEKSLYLEELFVLREYRGVGIGSRLFKELEKYAKDKGCQYFELSTGTKDYERALNFYIKKMKATHWSSYLIKNI